MKDNKFKWNDNHKYFLIHYNSPGFKYGKYIVEFKLELGRYFVRSIFVQKAVYYGHSVFGEYRADPDKVYLDPVNYEKHWHKIDSYEQLLIEIIKHSLEPTYLK